MFSGRRSTAYITLSQHDVTFRYESCQGAPQSTWLPNDMYHHTRRTRILYRGRRAGQLSSFAVPKSWYRESRVLSTYVERTDMNTLSGPRDYRLSEFNRWRMALISPGNLMAVLTILVGHTWLASLVTESGETMTRVATGYDSSEVTSRCQRKHWVRHKRGLSAGPSMQLCIPRTQPQGAQHTGDAQVASSHRDLS